MKPLLFVFLGPFSVGCNSKFTNYPPITDKGIIATYDDKEFSKLLTTPRQTQLCYSTDRINWRCGKPTDSLRIVEDETK